MKKVISFISLIIVLAIGSVLAFTSLEGTQKVQGITEGTQEVNDTIFSSKHIDDAGVRMTVKSGKGQVLDQTFYDKEHDIKVHFKRILTDDKETKLLVTYHSEEVNLKNYYIDLWEGVSKVNLIVGDEKTSLKNVGWGSRYYSKKENKVYEALSFESIKEYEGQSIRLELENLTIWKNNGDGNVQTTWPLEFKLKPSATFDRETVEVNKEFTFKDETYNIKQVEFSALETRVVVTGPNIQIYTDESGRQYEKRSKLEEQFLNPREPGEEYGYKANKKKTGVFLRSAGKKVVPIYSKEEVHDEDNYVMVFAPVMDRQNVLLEVGKDIEIPLTK
ncbi:DUF4179 domain-containing protein [Lentibacillus amyloliquefaciens]|uniref:DUF4179 domain-containing protein n=1 Tax=Lentibacillus amyloliquefaciens TaxID=1472767 RepID=A0A0U4E9E8_9BACI|nr:DUF4179 domain-containing protein [Lentibacillus amyloliquefaciens]ALX49473.1 hypothetical protein AOX59_13385 [Lentibacillus amyloliquefaciens]